MNRGKGLIFVLIIGLTGYLFIVFFKFNTSVIVNRISNKPIFHNENKASLDKCEGVLNQPLQGNVSFRPIPSENLMEKIASENRHVQKGGYFTPTLCNSSEMARDSVAIIIPFRYRMDHLYAFLQHMHPLLTRQGLEYKMYLVNQADDAPFNRGKLLNIGYSEAMKEKNWSCIVMHDVDHLPLNDNNFYTCWSQPRRMIAASSEFNFTYAAPYPNCFGGVTAMLSKQFEKVNGFRNDFYGWGGEDDDLAIRIVKKNMKIVMLGPKEGIVVGRYVTLEHEKAIPAEDRINKLKKTEFNMKTNGLNSLVYELKSKIEEQLYTNISVDLLYDQDYEML